jgi:hypothetical protein
MRMKVSIRADQLPVKLQPKALLARIDVNGRVHPAGGAIRTDMSQGKSIVSIHTLLRLTLPRRYQGHTRPVASQKVHPFKVSDNFSG